MVGRKTKERTYLTAPQPKILVLDIETKPSKAYVWKLFDENVGLEQLIEPGYIICVGAQWVGSQKSMFYSEWEHGRLPMLQAVHALLSEADAIVTYNGDRFDIAKLNGEFFLFKLPPVPPLTSIDLYKTIKKLGFASGKLAFIGPFLELGSKTTTPGFILWKKVIDGNANAQAKMKKYCLQDVKLTAKLYLRLRPYIKTHPYLSSTKSDECGACGGKHLQSRGYRRTKTFRIQRIQCQSCGSWQDGKREKMA